MRVATNKRALSLDLELSTIENALLGCRLLLDELDAGGGAQRSTLAATAGTVTLVIGRVKVLRAAVRAELDPSLLFTIENEAGARVAPHEDSDIRIPVGSHTPSTAQPKRTARRPE